MYCFNRIYVEVKPLMDTLAAALASKANADASMASAKAAVEAMLVERHLYMKAKA